jgi:hypothetical protein
MRVTLTLLLCLVAAEARAENPLLQQFIGEELSAPEKGFLAPSGRFRVRIPQGFELKDGSDLDTVILVGQIQGVDAALIVRRVDVVPGASSSQLLLTTRDRYLAKLPHYTVLRQGEVKVAGRRCAKLIGRYDYQGNKGYPQIVENAFVIDGADGFVIHMEIPEALYKSMAYELAEIYKSFKPIAAPKSAQ